MSAPAKIFIKVESSSEQQETLKNMRKKFKPLQSTATDKENLAGRSKVGQSIKSKIDIESTSTNIENIKQRKYENKSIQTDNLNLELLNEKSELKINEEDLTSTNNPSEHYWEILAEKRRQALEDTLDENKKLHERINSLEDELETSRRMIEEANGLVEILTEMLSENEPANKNEETEIDNEKPPTTIINSDNDSTDSD